MSALFEIERQPSQRWPLPFSPFPTTRVRRRAKPRYLSSGIRGVDIGMAVSGSEILRLPLFRQGEEVAAVCEAKSKDGTPRYPTVVILMPRRATKTTSVWAVLLGRCLHIPGYKVVTTAQDGIRARNRFREVQRELDAQDFDGSKGGQRIGRLRWANGDESIEFDNGSRIWVVPPEPGAFRGEAADCMYFDEAGELSLDRSEDLLAGALPLMDTRPNGQVIIAGTPGDSRAGLLWDTLERARAKTRGYGIVDYSLPDEAALVTYGDDAEPILDIDVLRSVHPGIGTLTTVAKMQARFKAMSLAQFEAEYACRFPFEAATAAISAAAWKECSGGGALPIRPDRVGLGFDVSPDSSQASLVAAWRDSDGIAHIEVLAQRPRTDWLTQVAGKAARKHRVSIGYDTIGANTEPAERLHRARIGIAGHGLRDMQAAAARLSADIEARKVRHYEQPDLTAAVEGAAWRMVGEGGRLFARKQSTHDVTALVAASVALRQFDQLPERRALSIITSEAS